MRKILQILPVLTLMLFGIGVAMITQETNAKTFFNGKVVKVNVKLEVDGKTFETDSRKADNVHIYIAKESPTVNFTWNAENKDAKCSLAAGIDSPDALQQNLPSTGTRQIDFGDRTMSVINFFCNIGDATKSEGINFNFNIANAINYSGGTCSNLKDGCCYNMVNDRTLKESDPDCAEFKKCADVDTATTPTYWNSDPLPCCSADLVEMPSGAGDGDLYCRAKASDSVKSKHIIDLSMTGPMEFVENKVEGFSSTKKYLISRNRPGLIYITMSDGLHECTSNLDLEWKGNSEPAQVGLSYAKKYEEMKPGKYYVKCKMFNNGKFDINDNGKSIEANIEVAYDDRPELSGEYKFDVMVVDENGNPRKGVPIEIMGLDDTKFQPGYRYDSDDSVKTFSKDVDSYLAANIYVDDSHPNMDTPVITDEQRWLKKGEGYYWQVCAKDDPSDCITEKDGVISKGTIQAWGASGQLIAWNAISNYDVVKLTIVSNFDSYYHAYEKVKNQKITPDFSEHTSWRDPWFFKVTSGDNEYFVGSYGQSGSEYIINIPKPNYSIEWNKYKYNNSVFYLKDGKDNSVVRLNDDYKINASFIGSDQRVFEFYNLGDSFHLTYSNNPLESLSSTKKIIIKYDSTANNIDDNESNINNDEDTTKVKLKLIGNVQDSDSKEKIAGVGSNVKMTIECSDGKVRNLNTKDGYFIYNINNLPNSGCKLINNTDTLTRDNWNVADYQYKGYTICKDGDIGDNNAECIDNVLEKNTWNMSSIDSGSKYQIVYYYDKLDVENKVVDSNLEDKIDQLILMIKKILEKLGIEL